MRRIALVVFGSAALSGSAAAQTSFSACGPLPDPADRQVMKVFEGLRVCLLALRPPSEAESPLEWAAKARTVILETQRDGDNRRAAISGNSITWTVNGGPAPLDSVAQAWQKAVVDLADATYQADALRREVAELRSQIDSLPQQVALTRAQIAITEKQDRDLNVTILNAGKKERELRNQLSQLYRQRSSVQSQASAAQAAASSARDERTRVAALQQAQAAQDQLMRIEEAISGVDFEISNSQSSRQVADAQEELRYLNPQKKLALLRLQLKNYESINPDEVELQIKSLDASTRQPALDADVQAALARLKALLR